MMIVCDAVALLFLVASEELDIVVESWRAELWKAIQISIDAKACHQGKDGLVKEPKEDVGGHVGDEGNTDNWMGKGINLVEVLSHMLHEHVAGATVHGDNSELSNEDEHIGKKVSEGELGSVLDIKEEPVPSSFAKALTGNGHVSVSSAVDVITDLFNAI